MLTKWILGNEKNSGRSGALWNTIGGTISAGQSAIILIFISHKMGIVTAGIVTIAYAVANLFMTMGKYGMRNFQVTDTGDRYSFGDYVYMRIFSVIAATVISCIYLVLCCNFAGYDFTKSVIIFEVIVLKMTDSLEDVYIGRYQQTGRLDIGAKIMALRLFISTLAICVVVCMGGNIHAALLIGIVISVIIDVYFIYRITPVTKTYVGACNLKNVRQLLKMGFPLCVGVTLSIYIGNAPKYMIDWYMDEETQAIFGYIMMPVFVITLLNQFLYQPVVKTLGDLWNEGQPREFMKKVGMQYLIIALLTIVVLVIGYFVGLPVLSVLYNTDLTSYGKEFAVLLFGGGCYALAYYLNVPITTIRKQGIIAAGYAAAALSTLIFGKYFVVSYGLVGASVLYLIINVILVLIYTLALIINVRKTAKSTGGNCNNDTI